MDISRTALLNPDQRTEVSNDPSIGAGNLLASALRVSPDPQGAFLYCARPLVNTDGCLQSAFSLVDLDHLAQSWSAWYLEQGVRPRDRVGVYLEDSFAYSLHLYALSQIGAIPVLINSHAHASTAAALCRQTEPVAIYTTYDRLQALEGTGALDGVRWVRTIKELPSPPANRLPDDARYRHSDDDPVAIMHSSGTTAVPKAVIHTHRSLAAGPKFRLVDHKEVPGSLMMTALPQSHLGCIAFSIYAVLGGTPLLPLYDPSGAELNRAVAKYKPTAVMAFGHTYSELAHIKVAPGSVDSVNVWISIGDATHHRHVRTILGYRSPSQRPAFFYDRFGTTELGWGVLLRVRTLESERNDRCVGTAVPVADVTVLRADGTEAAPGEVGYLAARGPAITPGYWNASDLTYRTSLAGYWLTGDAVYRDEKGSYYQVDRVVDVINTCEGVGYSVMMEEVLLNDVPAIIDCAVTEGAQDGRTWPVALVKVGKDCPDVVQLLKEANEALLMAGQPSLGLLHVARADEDFPLGVTGKVLKRQLKNRYKSIIEFAQVNPEVTATSLETVELA